MKQHDATEVAFKNGYEKAAKEIFEELDKITLNYLNDEDYSSGEMIYDIDQLKKKYIGE